MKRIIVYRLGSLGDTIVALPCLNKVRERFPDAKRILLTNNPVSASAPRMQDILRGSDLFHEIVTYDIATRSPGSIARLWWRLRRLHVDALVYLLTPRGEKALKRDFAFFRACGIRQIIGAPVSADLMFNRIDDHGEQEYECERLARCLESLGPIDLNEPRSWQIGLSTFEMSRGSDLTKSLGGNPFMAINMGTKLPANDWGHSNWIRLLASLLRTFEYLRWVFVGSPSDYNRAQDIVDMCPDRMLNLCGKLEIRESAAVLSRARLFDGHDSGPLHLAASCDVPCVGLFSTNNPRHKWFPYGAHHAVLYPDGAITTITVDQVFQIVAAKINAFSTVGSVAATCHN
jgi:heptosyltransferase-3